MPGWFTYPFKALSRTKPASRAIAEASESLMQSSAKMAEKAGELASKDAAGAAKLLEQASKTVQEGKALLNTETLSEAEKLAKMKRYGIIGAAGFLGYEKLIEGHGVVSSTAGLLLDTPEEGQGYLNKQWETFVGKHNAEKGLAEFGVDAVMGDGSYRQAADTMSDKYHGISERLSGFFSRLGQQPMPYPAQQGYDPAYYQAVNNPQAQVNQGGFLSRWGAATNGFSLPEYLSGLTGGNVTYSNLAQAIVGTFLTFGPFGKLAKLGGLLLGFNGYKNMCTPQQQASLHQQQGYGQGLSQQQFNMLMVTKQQNDYDEQQVIHRGRGMS